VTATASSGLPVTLSIDASATSICTISGSTSGSSVSFIGAGTCVIDANQAGNANYNAAPQAQQTDPVAKGAQTVTFTSTAPVNVHVGNTYVVTATASSGLPVVLSIDATATSICSISGSTSGSTVTFTAIGTCVIDANQPGNFNWNAAPQVQQTVQVINTPPMVIGSPKESFQTVGNTAFDFRPSAVSTPGIFVSGKLLDNFQPDPDGPSPLSVTLGTATAGAIVTINSSDGAFTYIPPAGKTGSDTFTYVVSDGMDSVTRTVTITFVSRVWYVKNNATAGGLGRSNDPFDTLAEAQSASGTGDYIFVYGGDQTTTGQAAGIVLKANQKLYGEAFGLTISGTVNGVVNPILVAANVANRPKIDNTAAGGFAVSIPNVTGTEVRCLSLTANTNAVNVTTSASGSGGAIITDNVITGSGAQAIKVVIGGTGTSSSVAIQNNSISATGNGIDTNATAGPLLLDIDNNAGILSSGASGIVVASSGPGSTTITGFANNSIIPNTAGTGISITNAIFDALPGTAGLQTVSGGTTTIGASGNGVGCAGFVMSGVSGDLSFTDLDIFADGGAGLSVVGSGSFTGSAGFQIAVGAGVGTIAAVGGPAVNVSSATINLPFAQITSTNSATTGVSLDTVAGTFSAGSGSTITNATGTSFNVNAGNAAVTYDGTITSSAGRVVSVTSTTGGTKSFTNTINGTGQGIFLNSNTGATINFSGQLTLSTGANPAFTATGGGTVTATNTASTVATTTGTAVNVANTTIGASGIKFKSVSANGGANGIVLDTTGASGGLTVLGTGSAGSGGTIRNMVGGDGATAGSGIFLNKTNNVSLSWMQLNDFQNFAIRGTSVSGFTLSNSVINGTNGNNASAPFNEGSVSFSELTGSVSITSTNISGGFADNFRVVNTTGTLNRITFTGDTFGTNSTGAGNDSLTMEAQSTAVLNATVQNCTFTAARGDLFQLNLLGTSTSDLVFTGNTLSNNHPAIATGGGGVTISGGDNSGTGSNLTYNISNNTFRDANGHAILIVKSTDPGTFSGTFNGNTIGVAAVADSGSVAGSGLKLQNAGLGTVSATITNNQIRQYNNFGIELETGGGATAQSGALNTTITGNTISNPGTGGLPMNGIQLNGGTVPGDTYQLCSKIGGAGALANSITGSGANGGTDFRLRQRQSTTVRLPGYGGANNDNTAVVTFVQGLNGGASGLASNTVGSGGGGFVGGGTTCP